jgi:hypothetical protein
MSARLSRLSTPVTAALFIGLTLVSFFASPDTPNSKASGTRVIAWFVAHRNTERVTDIISIFAMLFLVFFAGSLLGYLRRAPAAGSAAIVMLGGAVLIAAGFTVAVGIDYALTDVPSRLAPSAAQALNVLDNDVFFTVPLGGAVFAIPAGIAILRGAALPKWLGWVAIVLGIVMCSPAFFPAFLVLLVWALIVSILVYRRSDPLTPTPVPAVAGQ